MCRLPSTPVTPWHHYCVAVKDVCRENLAEQLLMTVPSARAQEQQVPTWDLNSFPLWHLGKLAFSLCVSVCVGVCHV